LEAAAGCCRGDQFIHGLQGAEAAGTVILANGGADGVGGKGCSGGEEQTVVAGVGAVDD
jgi:hypothetical protein